MNDGTVPPLVHLHLVQSDSTYLTRHSIRFLVDCLNCTTVPTSPQKSVNALSNVAFFLTAFRVSTSASVGSDGGGGKRIVCLDFGCCLLIS